MMQSVVKMLSFVSAYMYKYNYVSDEKTITMPVYTCTCIVIRVSAQVFIRIIKVAIVSRLLAILRPFAI